jgi:Ca-activated chloride channel family protein
MFAFGIGSSVNRHIIEGMARVGMGEPFVIAKQEEAEAQAVRFRAMITSPVLTNVKVDFDGFSAYDVEPLAIPDVFAERPVIVFGKWRGNPHGTITLSGISGDGNYKETIDVGKVKPMPANSALKYLWARHRITLLSDYNKLRADDRRIKEVTDLGLKYNLLTAYTSFVAVDSEIRNKDGKPTTVNQPLPLPQGVSDYAVGGTMQMRAAYAPMAKFKAEKSDARDIPAYKEVTGPSESASNGKIATPVFTIKDVTVTKGLTKDEVLKVVQSHLSEIEKCCAGGGLSGKLVFKMTLNADGMVQDVQVLSGVSGNDKTRQCIIGQVKKWQFPTAKDGRKVKVTVTLSES